MAKSKIRKKRKAPKKFDYLEPIDINKIGSEDDPCFGKLYDLSVDTCRMCGDNARCAIVTSQKQLVHKTDFEKRNRFKDLEVAEKDTIKEYISKKYDRGLSRFRIIKLCTKKFGENKKMYKQIYESIKIKG